MATKPAAKPVPPKQAPKTEMTVPNNFAVSDSRPSFMKEGGRGSENVTTADLVIPRLEVVQSLSPARNKAHADFIDGAEEGMLYNNVTRELYGESVTVIPVFFTKEWLIWKDRKKGGGFRGAFPTKAEAEAAIRALKTPEGKPEPVEDYTALDTAQHFCLLINKDKPQQIVISMSKSKMKVSRKWNSMMALSGDDSFAQAYRVESVDDKNSQNQDFKNIKVTRLGYVSESLYKVAEKMYETLRAGGVRADTSGFDADDDTTVSSKSEF
jgi:hypothetical protein